MEGTRTSEFLRLIYSSIIQATRDIASNSCDIFPPFLSRYVKYGNLELYLHGLELGYLVPKFQVHVYFQCSISFSFERNATGYRKV